MLKDKNNGFTIIEVVLVLAVAGLIFLVVFFALPNLQRARRDTQRKSDSAKLMSLLDVYLANEASLPILQSQIDEFEAQYVVQSDYVDPLAGNYYIQGISEDVPNGHQVYPELGEMFFKARHICNANRGGPGTDQITHTSVPHQSVVVWTRLETGGVYCVDNR